MSEYMRRRRYNGDAGLAVIWGTPHATQRPWPLQQQARTALYGQGIAGAKITYMQRPKPQRTPNRTLKFPKPTGSTVPDDSRGCISGASRPASQSLSTSQQRPPSAGAQGPPRPANTAATPLDNGSWQGGGSAPPRVTWRRHTTGVHVAARPL